MKAALTAISVLAILAASTSVHAWLPKKCIDAAGNIEYSGNRLCPDGVRDRIDGGTISAVTSQTIQSRETFIPNTKVLQNPVAERVQPPKPALTQQIK
jgi:hypothetical protein